MKQSEDKRNTIRRIVFGAASASFGGASATARSNRGDPPPQVTGSMAKSPFEAHRRVRIGFIGLGVRGVELLANTMPLERADIVALCDSVADRAALAANILMKSGRSAPDVYSGSEDAWERLCKLNLDLVIIATPWEWHTPMALRAMNSGAHVGVEIPAATKLDDCWKLVRTSERTKRHCMLLENVCYGQEELLVLNMIRAGVFGDIVHCEGASIHDLRAQLAEIPPNGGRGGWRRRAHRERIGDLYPTHGLGPLANYLDINRGDLLASIVSVSSRERGLSSFVARHAKPGAPIREERYRAGDMTTSMLRTRSGVSVMLQHCVTGPRPYTRHNLVQGTLGAFAGFPARIYLDSRTSKGHPEWQPLGDLAKAYEHPLWSKEGETARKLGGHGGMDYIMMYRLLDSMTSGREPDIDVYDAAAWSCVTALSAESIRQKGATLTIPDFTNGQWAAGRTRFLG